MVGVVLTCGFEVCEAKNVFLEKPLVCIKIFPYFCKGCALY